MREVLFHKPSSGQDITVYDTNEWDGEKGRFRLLEFGDQAMQGAMDLAIPDRVLFEYPRAILHLMSLNIPNDERVFLIGHGIGTIARQLPENRCTVAELEPEIAAISRTFFGYPYNNVLVGDGRRLLQAQADASLGGLVLDAFTAKGTPSHLTSLEFFEEARAKLSPEGAMLINLMGRGKQDPGLCAVGTTLEAVFPYVVAFILPSEDKRASISRHNVLLAAAAHPLHCEPRSMAGFIETKLEMGYVIRDGK
ncbi:spermidine synthase [Paenibacillus whitsoniae]|uniref:Spermidine synthase n=1 Tax=Paenibacillus whitsoniae TaxID=2496558 RepID=A0A3S0A7W8_9BACL|nr:fused MFS/spermidine synthase [Paenibacillus whitsoniae]RTE11751.1 spermidine synthase [Paenibacillus whitsoniae]